MTAPDSESTVVIPRVDRGDTSEFPVITKTPPYRVTARHRRLQTGQWDWVPPTVGVFALAVGATLAGFGMYTMGSVRQPGPRVPPSPSELSLPGTATSREPSPSRSARSERRRTRPAPAPAPVSRSPRRRTPDPTPVPRPRPSVTSSPTPRTTPTAVPTELPPESPSPSLSPPVSPSPHSTGGDPS